MYLVKGWENYVPYHTKEMITAWTVDNVERAQKYKQEALCIISKFKMSSENILGIMRHNKHAKEI